MKKFSLATLALATLALTACGGGGSDSTTVTTTTTTPTTNTATKPVINVNPAISGNMVRVGSNKAKESSATNGTSAINKVVIDGKEVDFLPTGFSSNVLNMQNVNYNGTTVNRVGGSSNLSYTRYGYIQEGDTGTPYLFAQGQTATNVPTTGTATYKGYGTQLASEQFSIAEAEFNVDYGNKTLTGTVGSTALSATISGNSFSGTKDDITTTGKFYGPNAEELGGIYKNESGTVAGAFGAKK